MIELPRPILRKPEAKAIREKTASRTFITTAFNQQIENSFIRTVIDNISSLSVIQAPLILLRCGLEIVKCLVEGLFPVD